MYDALFPDSLYIQLIVARKYQGFRANSEYLTFIEITLFQQIISDYIA